MPAFPTVVIKEHLDVLLFKNIVKKKPGLNLTYVVQVSTATAINRIRENLTKVLQKYNNNNCALYSSPLKVKKKAMKSVRISHSVGSKRKTNDNSTKQKSSAAIRSQTQTQSLSQSLTLVSSITNSDTGATEKERVADKQKHSERTTTTSSSKQKSNTDSKKTAAEIKKHKEASNNNLSKAHSRHHSKDSHSKEEGKTSSHSRKHLTENPHKTDNNRHAKSSSSKKHPPVESSSSKSSQTIATGNSVFKGGGNVTGPSSTTEKNTKNHLTNGNTINIVKVVGEVKRKVSFDESILEINEYIKNSVSKYKEKHSKRNGSTKKTNDGNVELKNSETVKVGKSDIQKPQSETVKQCNGASRSDNQRSNSTDSKRRDNPNHDYSENPDINRTQVVKINAEVPVSSKPPHNAYHTETLKLQPKKPLATITTSSELTLRTREHKPSLDPTERSDKSSNSDRKRKQLKNNGKIESSSESVNKKTEEHHVSRCDAPSRRYKRIIIRDDESSSPELPNNCKRSPSKNIPKDSSIPIDTISANLNGNMSNSKDNSCESRKHHRNHRSSSRRKREHKEIHPTDRETKSSVENHIDIPDIPDIMNQETLELPSSTLRNAKCRNRENSVRTSFSGILPELVTSNPEAVMSIGENNDSLEEIESFTSSTNEKLIFEELHSVRCYNPNKDDKLLYVKMCEQNNSSEQSGKTPGINFAVRKLITNSNKINFLYVIKGNQSVPCGVFCYLINHKYKVVPTVVEGSLHMESIIKQVEILNCSLLANGIFVPLEGGNFKYIYIKFETSNNVMVIIKDVIIEILQDQNFSNHVLFPVGPNTPQLVHSSPSHQIPSPSRELGIICFEEGTQSPSPPSPASPPPSSTTEEMFLLNSRAINTIIFNSDEFQGNFNTRIALQAIPLHSNISIGGFQYFENVDSKKCDFIIRITDNSSTERTNSPTIYNEDDYNEMEEIMFAETPQNEDAHARRTDENNESIQLINHGTSIILDSEDTPLTVGEILSLLKSDIGTRRPSADFPVAANEEVNNVMKFSLQDKVNTLLTINDSEFHEFDEIIETENGEALLIPIERSVSNDLDEETECIVIDLTIQEDSEEIIPYENVAEFSEENDVKANLDNEDNEDDSTIINEREVAIKREIISQSAATDSILGSILGIANSPTVRENKEFLLDSNDSKDNVDKLVVEKIGTTIDPVTEYDDVLLAMESARNHLVKSEYLTDFTAEAREENKNEVVPSTLNSKSSSRSVVINSENVVSATGENPKFSEKNKSMENRNAADRTDVGREPGIEVLEQSLNPPIDDGAVVFSLVSRMENYKNKVVCIPFLEDVSVDPIPEISTESKCIVKNNETPSDNLTKQIPNVDVAYDLNIDNLPKKAKVEVAHDDNIDIFTEQAEDVGVADDLNIDISTEHAEEVVVVAHDLNIDISINHAEEVEVAHDDNIDNLPKKSEVKMVAHDLNIDNLPKEAKVEVAHDDNIDNLPKKAKVEVAHDDNIDNLPKKAEVKMVVHDLNIDNLPKEAKVEVAHDLNIIDITTEEVEVACDLICRVVLLKEKSSAIVPDAIMNSNSASQEKEENLEIIYLSDEDENSTMVSNCAANESVSSKHVDTPLDEPIYISDDDSKDGLHVRLSVIQETPAREDPLPTENKSKMHYFQTKYLDYLRTDIYTNPSELDKKVVIHDIPDLTLEDQRQEDIQKCNSNPINTVEIKQVSSEDNMTLENLICRKSPCLEFSENLVINEEAIQEIAQIEIVPNRTCSIILQDILSEDKDNDKDVSQLKQKSVEIDNSSVTINGDVDSHNPPEITEPENVCSSIESTTSQEVIPESNDSDMEQESISKIVEDAGKVNSSDAILENNAISNTYSNNDLLESSGDDEVRNKDDLHMPDTTTEASIDKSINSEQCPSNIETDKTEENEENSPKKLPLDNEESSNESNDNISIAELKQQMQLTNEDEICKNQNSKCNLSSTLLEKVKQKENPLFYFPDNKNLRVPKVFMYENEMCAENYKKKLEHQAYVLTQANKQSAISKDTCLTKPYKDKNSTEKVNPPLKLTIRKTDSRSTRRSIHSKYESSSPNIVASNAISINFNEQDNACNSTDNNVTSNSSKVADLDDNELSESIPLDEAITFITDQAATAASTTTSEADQKQDDYIHVYAGNVGSGIQEETTSKSCPKAHKIRMRRKSKLHEKPLYEVVNDFDEDANAGLPSTSIGSPVFLTANVDPQDQPYNNDDDVFAQNTSSLSDINTSAEDPLKATSDVESQQQANTTKPSSPVSVYEKPLTRNSARSKRKTSSTDLNPSTSSTEPETVSKRPRNTNVATSSTVVATPRRRQCRSQFRHDNIKIEKVEKRKAVLKDEVMKKIRTAEETQAENQPVASTSAASTIPTATASSSTSASASTSTSDSKKRKGEDDRPASPKYQRVTRTDQDPALEHISQAFPNNNWLELKYQKDLKGSLINVTKRGIPGLNPIIPNKEKKKNDKSKRVRKPWKKSSKKIVPATLRSSENIERVGNTRNEEHLSLPTIDVPCSAAESNRMMVDRDQNYPDYPDPPILENALSRYLKPSHRHKRSKSTSCERVYNSITTPVRSTSEAKESPSSIPAVSQNVIIINPMYVERTHTQTSAMVTLTVTPAHDSEIPATVTSASAFPSVIVQPVLNTDAETPKQTTPTLRRTPDIPWDKASWNIPKLAAKDLVSSEGAVDLSRSASQSDFNFAIPAKRKVTNPAPQKSSLPSPQHLIEVRRRSTATPFVINGEATSTIVSDNRTFDGSLSDVYSDSIGPNNDSSFHETSSESSYGVDRDIGFGGDSETHDHHYERDAERVNNIAILAPYLQNRPFEISPSENRTFENERELHRTSNNFEVAFRNHALGSMPVIQNHPIADEFSSSYRMELLRESRSFERESQSNSQFPHASSDDSSSREGVSQRKLFRPYEKESQHTSNNHYHSVPNVVAPPAPRSYAYLQSAASMINQLRRSIGRDDVTSNRENISLANRQQYPEVTARLTSAREPFALRDQRLMMPPPDERHTNAFTLHHNIPSLPRNVEPDYNALHLPPPVASSSAMNNSQSIRNYRHRKAATQAPVTNQNQHIREMKKLHKSQQQDMNRSYSNIMNQELRGTRNTQSSSQKKMPPLLPQSSLNQSPHHSHSHNQQQDVTISLSNSDLRGPEIAEPSIGRYRELPLASLNRNLLKNNQPPREITISLSNIPNPEQRGQQNAQTFICRGMPTMPSQRNPPQKKQQLERNISLLNIVNPEIRVTENARESINREMPPLVTQPSLNRSPQQVRQLVIPSTVGSSQETGTSPATTRSPYIRVNQSVINPQLNEVSSTSQRNQENKEAKARSEYLWHALSERESTGPKNPKATENAVSRENSVTRENPETSNEEQVRLEEIQQDESDKRQRESERQYMQQQNELAERKRLLQRRMSVDGREDSRSRPEHSESNIRHMEYPNSSNQNANDLNLGPWMHANRVPVSLEEAAHNVQHIIPLPSAISMRLGRQMSAGNHMDHNRSFERPIPPQTYHHAPPRAVRLMEPHAGHAVPWDPTMEPQPYIIATRNYLPQQPPPPPPLQAVHSRRMSAANMSAPRPTYMPISNCFMCGKDTMKVCPCGGVCVCSLACKVQSNKHRNCK